MIDEVDRRSGQELVWLCLKRRCNVLKVDRFSSRVWRKTISWNWGRYILADAEDNLHVHVSCWWRSILAEVAEKICCVFRSTEFHQQCGKNINVCLENSSFEKHSMKFLICSCHSVELCEAGLTTKPSGQVKENGRSVPAQHKHSSQLEASSIWEDVFLAYCQILGVCMVASTFRHKSQ